MSADKCVKIKKCIYCKTENKELFKGVEHVMPQSFGTFGSKTPILECVCDDCNAYFGKNLDQVLARDTLEGITRYKKGIFSSEQRFPKSLRFELEENEENGKYGGTLLGGYDSLTGKSIGVISQFWIRNVKTSKWEKYKIDQIKNIKITADLYGSTEPGKREMSIRASSKEEYDNVMTELKRCGIPYKEKEIFDHPPFIEKADLNNETEVKIIIEGKIDEVRKKALIKIIFNFATYILGSEETLKPEWDNVREFVRYNGKELMGKFNQEPFWTGQETEDMRFDSDSYNLRIENENNNVVGVIQLYNVFTYKFILVKNYSIPSNKETAYRLTPGQEPQLGIKMMLPKIK